jgi:DNA-binding response OmpR family regulator
LGGREQFTLDSVLANAAKVLSSWRYNEVTPMDATSRNVLRILIVEDDADIADSMAMVLRLCGHVVVLAPDGPTALQMADDNPPDVVLLDIVMPKMDGWGVAKELRQRRTKPRPLIIAVTGHGYKAARLRSYEAGIDVHLVKPVDPTEVVSLLSRYQRIVMPRTSEESRIAPPESPPIKRGSQTAD